MYDLSDVLDVGALTAVQPGTSLLVSGPAMSGTATIVRDILASGARHDEGTVAVLTNDMAEKTIEELQEREPDADPRTIAAIDARGEGASGADETDAGAYIYRVGDPGDLTGMGIGITQSFERLDEYGVDQTRLGLSSLSTLLTYTDTQTVFKFCHVLSSRVDTAGYLSAFAIDESAHEEQTLQIVKQPFDGMIEVRERDGTREARVRGIQSSPSDWLELSS
jgi:KaiC/GvpD/RAD55 family RecA-like ATPase